MTIASFVIYSNAVLEMTKGSFDLASDRLALVLVTDAYVPNPDTDSIYAAISANELPTGNGYTTGGMDLSTVLDVLSGGIVTFTAAPVTWQFFTGTFRYAVIVRHDGNAIAASDLLLCYADCTGGGSDTGTGGPLTLTPDVSGIFRVVHS